METSLTHVAHQFLWHIPRDAIAIRPYGTGLINNTYLVEVTGAGAAGESAPSPGESRSAPPGAPSPGAPSPGREAPGSAPLNSRYILQRINTAVFQNPHELMDNARRITHHLAIPHTNQLEFLPTHDGTVLYQDGDGGFWRMSTFIQGSYALDLPRSPEDAYYAAHAFGSYQRRLSDLPGPRLHETIPGFHDTPRRFTTFLRALSEDRYNRAIRCAEEVALIQKAEDLLHQLHELHRQGALPERITHNDTKISNVLFGQKSHRPICVIDLDTTMPGFVAHDFGDLVRTAAVTIPEDSETIPANLFSEELFRALSRGYIDAAAGFLTTTERETLVLGAIVIALEQAMRFLTDFLQGDVYYGAQKHAHNLVRCRTQLALASALKNNQAHLETWIAQAPPYAN